MLAYQIGEVLLYDKFVNDNRWMRHDWKVAIEGRKINDDFIDATGTLFTSAARISLSAKGIEDMLRVMDDRITPTDMAPKFMTNCRYAVAVKNLAIQVFYATCNSTKTVTIDYLHKAYTNSGVDYSLYSLPEGYGVGSAYRGN